MEVYLIRHTTPLVEKGVIYGQLDVDVMDSFEKETATIKAQLPSSISEYYSSPLQRCTKLAQSLANTFFLDERLMEVNFGDWEGKTWDTVDQIQLNYWMESFTTAAPPNGESMTHMLKRVQEFWNELQTKNYPSVAIITHAGVIRLISAIVEKKELKDVFELKVDYGEVINYQLPTY